MSLQDMPQLPPEYLPRMEKLIDKVKAGELSIAQVLGTMMGPALGRMMPVVMNAAGDQIAGMIPGMMSILPAMMGRKLFVRIEDVGYFIVRIGYLPKPIELIPSTFKEVKAARIPGMTVSAEVIPYMLQGIEGMVRMMGSGKIRIYGMKEMAGWLKDIPDGSAMINSMFGMFSLMTKEVLSSMQEPMVEAADAMFSTYGV